MRSEVRKFSSTGGRSHLSSLTILSPGRVSPAGRIKTKWTPNSPPRSVRLKYRQTEVSLWLNCPQNKQLQRREKSLMYYKDNTTRSERVGQMIIKLWDGLSGYIEASLLWRRREKDYS